MYNAVVCRYHEIAIKGNNRREFERQLIGNMRFLLRSVAPCRVRHIRGRVWVEPEAENTDFSPDALTGIREVLARVFGLESFSPAKLVRPDMAEIEAAVREIAPDVFAPYLADGGTAVFRIRARRSDKNFPLRSKEIEIALAGTVEDLFGEARLKIDLDHAPITIGCEVREEFAAIFAESFEAPGGLPVGSSGRVLVLLSGGIDSPVAAYEMMKRGCQADFVTFHSPPYTPPESSDKVRKLAALLNRYQYPGKLYLCNLAEFQKLVRNNCLDRDRTVLYRRAMLRIAEKIALATGAGALVTGEAVGQVASQTLRNMATIDSAVEILVLRPLCGYDKNESVRVAQAIGTYPVSIIHAPDSCTVFAPASPSTAVPKLAAEREETRVPDYAALLDRIADAALASPETPA